MKLIKIVTDKKITSTKFKTSVIKGTINGVEYSKEVKTEIPESSSTHHEIYWIPINKINGFKQLNEDCLIYTEALNIKVNKKEFDKIKAELENYWLQNNHE